MRHTRPFSAAAVALLVFCAVVASPSVQSQPDQLDAEAIGKIVGVKAAVADDGVVRLEWSRTDVRVTVSGSPLPPAAGLGSWAAFKAIDGRGGAMMMGDTVVFEDEITPAMDAAFASGLEITALHNHFIYDRPPVYFMHIGGTGDPDDLAAGVKAVWDAIKKQRQQWPEPAVQFGGQAAGPHDGGFDAEGLRDILGTGPAAVSEDGVVKFTIGREARMHGESFGASMGLSTWAAFTGSPNAAAVDGDFAMTREQVQPVMHALRKADIHIVALHNHMIGEAPAYYFLHYWGMGSAQELARGVRQALDAQESAPGGH